MALSLASDQTATKRSDQRRDDLVLRRSVLFGDILCAEVDGELCVLCAKRVDVEALRCVARAGGIAVDVPDVCAPVGTCFRQALLNEACGASQVGRKDRRGVGRTAVAAQERGSDLLDDRIRPDLPHEMLAVPRQALPNAPHTQSDPRRGFGGSEQRRSPAGNCGRFLSRSSPRRCIWVRPP